MAWIINKSTTPGTPKNPAISAVTGFIPIVSPMNPPMKFTNRRITPPIIPLIISFSIIFIGTTSSRPMTYNATRPTANAIIVLGSNAKLSPVSFF